MSARVAIQRDHARQIGVIAPTLLIDVAVRSAGNLAHLKRLLSILYEQQAIDGDTFAASIALFGLEAA